MSRLDELIKQHCPQGVTFRTLGQSVLRNLGGGTPSRSQASYWDGDIPWASVGDITSSEISIDSTRQFISQEGLKNCSTNLIPRGHVVVAVKIKPGAMRVVETPIAINQDIRALELRDDLDPYFLTYYFATLNVLGNGTIVQGITNSTLEKILIPVPPIEVQREIVDILDRFTRLEAELEAELEARRKQYEHFLNELLSFKNVEGGGKVDING